jgi:hypothetical protein
LKSEDALQFDRRYIRHWRLLIISIIVNLTDEHLSKLKEMAGRLRVSPEDLARMSIEELIALPIMFSRKMLSFTGGSRNALLL